MNSAMTQTSLGLHFFDFNMRIITDNALDLLNIFHGKDAVADADAFPEGEIHQPTRALAADVIVVAGFATHDAAERDEAIIERAACGMRDGGGNLERAGHDDAVERGISFSGGGFSAALHCVSDGAVVRRSHQQ